MTICPHITVILAMSLDGKIADFQKNPARFGSNNDKTYLEEQIALVDAVIIGAGTLRSYQTSLPITNSSLLNLRLSQQKPLQPTHIICSASGNLNPNWRFFQQPIPRWLLTTIEGKENWMNNNSQSFDQILVTNNQDKKINWPEAFKKLLDLDIQRIAVLGGGNLIATLLSENWIDEWKITLCPLILGGKTAPSPVEGIGLTGSHAQKLELISLKTIDHEIFLHYKTLNSQ